MATNQNNLGYKVTWRDYSEQQLVEDAWGTEFFAPDHGIYEFSNGRKFDSTDRGITGIYNNLAQGFLYLQQAQWYAADTPAYLLQQNGFKLVLG